MPTHRTRGSATSLPASGGKGAVREDMDLGARARPPRARAPCARPRRAASAGPRACAERIAATARLAVPGQRRQQPSLDAGLDDHHLRAFTEPTDERQGGGRALPRKRDGVTSRDCIDAELSRTTTTLREPWPMTVGGERTVVEPAAVGRRRWRDREASTFFQRLHATALDPPAPGASGPLPGGWPGPSRRSWARASRKVVVVLDSSASMQSRDVTPSRFRGSAAPPPCPLVRGPR